MSAQWDELEDVPTHCPHCAKPIGPLWWTDAPDETVERWIEGGGTIRIEDPGAQGLRGLRLFNQVQLRHLNRRITQRREHAKRRRWLFCDRG